MKYSIINVFVVLSFVFFSIFTSCKKNYDDASEKRMNDEKQALIFLEKARLLMKRQEYNEAKNTIKVMRDSCYYALHGRYQGILLLDSIELQKAQNDTTLEDYETRIQFYRKKLEHDKRNLPRH